MSQKHIRIIGPSSSITRDRINEATSWLEEKGFLVTVADQVFFQHHQSAGTIQDKIDALHEAYSDPDVDIILASRGGNEAIHILPHVDWNIIKNNPKKIIGFSDITVLLNAIYQQTGQITYHGPPAGQIKKGLPDDHLHQFCAIMNGDCPEMEWSDCNVKNPADITGTLIGGNLSVFQTLTGTPFMPTGDDFILFLEDVGDEISRYDRMLGHLKLAGLFERCNAILFGDFHSSDNPNRAPFGKTMDQVIDDITADLNIPIITNCPFGHGEQLVTLPIGAKMSLKFNNDEVKIKTV